MSAQANIIAKTGLTCTGTTTNTFVARGVTLNGGKPAKQIANYRYLLNSEIPAADTVFRVSSGERSVSGKYGPGWQADARLEAPVMEVVQTGSPTGYAAAPKAADYSGLWLSGTFSDRMVRADKAALWDQLCYMMVNDSSLKEAFIGRDQIT